MARRVLGLLLLALALPLGSQAARTVSAEKPILVRLELHYMVSITFPEAIDKVMAFGVADAQRPAAPAEQQRISYEVHAHVLGLAVLQPDVVGNMIVIGTSGRTYMVQYKVGSPRDEEIEVAPMTPKVEEQRLPYTRYDFLRDLKLGRTAPGQLPETVPLPGLPDGRVRIRSAQAVGLPQWVGLTLQLDSTVEEPLTLDVRVGVSADGAPGVVALAAWTWPPGLTLRLVHAEPAPLAPHGQTTVYLVFARRSVP